MYEKNRSAVLKLFSTDRKIWRTSKLLGLFVQHFVANVPTRILRNHSETQLLFEFSSRASDQLVLISTHRQYCSAFPIAAPRRLAPRRVKAGATHYWTEVRRATTFVPWVTHASCDVSCLSVHSTQLFILPCNKHCDNANGHTIAR